MEFKITLKDVIVFFIITAVFASIFVYCTVQFSALKAEVKYSQNFTAIVNQVNQNTKNIGALMEKGNDRNTNIQR